MRDRFSGSEVTVAVAIAAVSAAILVSVSQASGQAPSASDTALKTPWGEPDLQGIWTDEFDTPLQRSAKYANQEFFTPAQREELDQLRGAHYGSDPRQERGSANDVGGAYNTAFLTIKHAGPRTSLIVEPPNGRIPPQTPEARTAATADSNWARMESPALCTSTPPALSMVGSQMSERAVRRDSNVRSSPCSTSRTKPATSACRIADSRRSDRVMGTQPS